MSLNTHSFAKNIRDKKPEKLSGKFSAKTSHGKPTHYLLGAALSVGLMATSLSPSEAAMVKLGNVDVQIDTTVSAGLSMRMEERENSLLAASNGGNPDTTPGVNLGGGALTDLNGNGVVGDAADLLGAGGAACGLARMAAMNSNAVALLDCQFDDAADGEYNYDRGLNGDDGRLNFDDGDLTSAPVKLVSDIQVNSGPFTFFARANAFYDAILDDASSFERTDLNGARTDAVADVDLLDFYLDYDGELGGNPFLIRVGRQVINWGESTFFLGGNSVFSPIDVPAIRRPGAEIKEALLPVEAIYGSLSVTDDVTIEAYIGGWDKFQIDVGGTAFAGSDAANAGSAANGPRFYVGTGRFAGSNKRNCDGAHRVAPNRGNEAAAAGYSAAIKAALDTHLGTCAVGDSVDFRTPLELGRAEESRRRYDNEANENNLGDTDFFRRGVDDEPEDEFADYGLALRWYAENLNSTEFGFYYQNYTSRIPYASSRAQAPRVGVGTTGVTDSATLRQFGVAGCAGATANFTADATANASMDGVVVEDPLGLLPIFAGVASSFGYGGAGTNLSNDDFADMACDLIALQMGRSTPLNNATAFCAAAPIGTPGCDISGSTGAKKSALDVSGAGLYLPTGSVFPVLRYGGEIFLEYPEEIEVFGVSFATTIGGWGVQGEVAHRPDMPLHIDGDMLAISAISGSCAWENFGAAAPVLYGLQLSETSCGDYDTYHGWVEADSTVFDIGTTATFTRSNPIISFLGADLGVLLTEIQHVSVPDAEDYAVDYDAGINMEDEVSDTNQRIGAIAADRKPRLINRCTTGSDLPLGGVLSLDPRSPEECRPTNESTGALMLFQLQYNNVFGSAWSLQPRFVYSVGLSGMSPSPVASWVEDQSVMGLSVTAAYQEFDVSLGLTQYDGDVLYNPNIDRDTLNLSVKFGF